MLNNIDKTLPQILSYLKSEYSPIKIYLFGSRAKGTARSNSDYDFVIVTSSKITDKWIAYNKSRREIFEKFNATADVWVYSQNEFDQYSQEFGTMPETALNTGIEV